MHDNQRQNTHGLQPRTKDELNKVKSAPAGGGLQTCLTAQPGRFAPAGRK